MRINVDDMRDCLDALRVRIENEMKMEEVKRLVSVYQRLNNRLKTYTKQIVNQ